MPWLLDTTKRLSGHIVVGILSAALAILGYYHEWAAFMIAFLGDWATPTRARNLFWIAASILMMWATWPLLAGMWRSPVWAERGRLRLSEIARYSARSKSDEKIRLQTLRDAVVTGQLKRVDERPQIDGWTIVARHDFRLYAALSGIPELQKFIRQWDRYSPTGGTGVRASPEVNQNDELSDWLRWRWWHAVWAAPPFRYSRALERLKFIDAWRHFPLDHPGTPLLSTNPLSISLERRPSVINDYNVVCALTVHNNGPPLNGCIVQVHEIDRRVPDQMPLPLVLRTEGQIRDPQNRKGRFSLSSKQTKTVPVLFCLPRRPNEWFFFDENRQQHPLSARQTKVVVYFFGGNTFAKALLSIDVENDWRPRVCLDPVRDDFALESKADETTP